MAHETDPERALRGMPGRRGWDRIVRSLEARGATGSELAGILDAIRAFEVHLGEHGLVWSDLSDRAAEAREPSVGGEDITEARRAAHAGAIGLYGVRTRLLLASYLVAPGAGEGTLSLGSFGLVDGLRRTRSGDAWPILQRPVIEEDGSAVSRHVSCGDVRGFPNLIACVSSSGLGGGVFERRRIGPRTEVVMFTGEARGDDRGIRAGFGEALLDLPFAASAVSEETGFGSVQLVTSFITPANVAVIEVLLHRDLEIEAEPAVSLLGTPIGPENFGDRRHAQLLPLEARCGRVVTRGLPHRFGSIARARTEGLRRVADALGRRPAEFTAYRLELPFPPVFASASLDFAIRAAGG